MFRKGALGRAARADIVRRTSCAIPSGPADLSSFNARTALKISSSLIYFRSARCSGFASTKFLHVLGQQRKRCLYMNTLISAMYFILHRHDRYEV